VTRALGIALALLVCGCGQAKIGDTHYTAEDLPCASLDADSGIWTSTTWPMEGVAPDPDAGIGCGFLPLPPREHVVLEHGLGRDPGTVTVYIAFDPSGVGATLASGDPVRIIDVTATELTLENHTEQGFYMRVALQ
jgi:hypothetical protein